MVTTVYLLSNRNNLNYILSSGFIGPAASYRKYYEDLGQYVPDYIPLLSKHPDAKLVKQFLTLEGNNFPVLIEINIEKIDGKVLKINEKLDLIEDEVLSQTDSGNILILTRGVIPSQYISNIMFRSADEKTEFLSRQYENIPQVEKLLIVSPESFDGEDTKSEELVNILSNIDDSKSADNLSEAILLSNKVNGASILLSYLVSRYPNVSLKLITSYMDSLLQQPKSDPSLSITEFWMTIIPEITLSQDLGKSKRVTQFASKHYMSGQLVDTYLLIAIVDYIKNIENPNQFVPEVALSEIQEIFEAIVEDTIENPSRYVQQYGEIFVRIRKVLNSVMDLDQFFSFLVDDTNITIALLCFLMRPRPSDIFTWVEEENRPDWDIIAISTIFVGLLFGRSRTPIETSPSSEMISFIDYLNCIIINHHLDGLDLPGLTSDLEIHNTSVDGNLVERLQYHTRVLIEREFKSLNTAEIVSYFSSLSNDNEKSIEIAIQLANQLHWESCITSVVYLNDKDFIVEYHSRKKEIRVQGKIALNQELNLSEFLKRIKTITSNDLTGLSAQLKSRLRQIIQS